MYVSPSSVLTPHHAPPIVRLRLFVQGLLLAKVGDLTEMSIHCVMFSFHFLSLAKMRWYVFCLIARVSISFFDDVCFSERSMLHYRLETVWKQGISPLKGRKYIAQSSLDGVSFLTTSFRS